MNFTKATGGEGSTTNAILAGIANKVAELLSSNLSSK